MAYPSMTQELGTRLDEAAKHTEVCSRCNGSDPRGGEAPMCIIATDHLIRLAGFWTKRNREFVDTSEFRATRKRSPRAA